MPPLILPQTVRRWKDTAILAMNIYYFIMGAVFWYSVTWNSIWGYVLLGLMFIATFVPLDLWTPERY